jgi:molybdopterin adenylyltransferase
VLTIAVVTISDRAFRGEYADRSGPAIRQFLQGFDPTWQIETAVVPDERDLIEKALQAHLHCDYILTSGGTGIGPRDRTPEICQAFCDREIPGIGEWLRRESMTETPFAVFSRGYAGISGHTIIVNFPGSIKAAGLCIRLLAPVMAHGIAMIRGEGH